MQCRKRFSPKAGYPAVEDVVKEALNNVSGGFGNPPFGAFALACPSNQRPWGLYLPSGLLETYKEGMHPTDAPVSAGGPCTGAKGGVLWQQLWPTSDSIGVGSCRSY